MKSDGTGFLEREMRIEREVYEVVGGGASWTQPELLSGSVRENLDPFGQQDDATLNSALRSAGLFSLQEDLEEEGEDRITLDSAVASGGNNLSIEQRQIVALARAMVRESRLLILDEATSAIADYQTDSIIQSSLRNELNKETSLITVAHRLQTIMDADKILNLVVLCRTF
ncbi:hypothetical protein D9757_010720 [Collybiopsis confluens]|uniref:ABC transporter domain-containing protein n=1 Tax=Collybiopsis confluens TaxID=2823264 RepID=A0A8H5GZF9_9AGAR|nr:hypothetical protein D9757_010720 [Collybiopsis confluens]